MTKSEIVKRLQTIRDIMQKGDFFYADAEVMTAAIEAINTPDSGGTKLDDWEQEKQKAAAMQDDF